MEFQFQPVVRLLMLLNLQKFIDNNYHIMKTKKLILLFNLLLFQACFSQNAKTEKQESSIKISDNFNSASSLLLYKFNPKNSCDQSKAVSIIKDNKISQCFDFVKTFNGTKVKEILNLLNNEDTYGNEDVACFDTDHALILYNVKNEVVGYINISESCNKLISNPEIKEMEFYSQGGLRKVGFSKKGKDKIKQILGI